MHSRNSLLIRVLGNCLASRIGGGDRRPSCGPAAGAGGRGRGRGGGGPGAGGGG